MGTDKGLVRFRGMPLVQYPIDLLSLCCRRLLISSNNPEYRQFGFEVIADDIENAGPMAGIASCLKESRTELNLVLSCDMPLLEVVVLNTLLRNSPAKTFVVPLDKEGRAEPLCAFYSDKSLQIIESLLGMKNFRMTELFKHGSVNYVNPGDYPISFNENWFANFNTLDDVTNAGSFIL
jgi:molybdopterin-guanine dinucleotide biosynthesis protein A